MYLRLSRALAACKLFSRREAEVLVKDGMLAVNGVTADISEPLQIPYEGMPVIFTTMDHADTIPASLREESTLFAFDSKRLRKEHRKKTLILNKPRGYVCSNPERHKVVALKLCRWSNYLPKHQLMEQNGRLIPTEVDQIPSIKPGKAPFQQKHAGYAPAGRLDENSRGLALYSQKGIVPGRFLTDRPFSLPESVDIVDALTKGQYVKGRLTPKDTTVKTSELTIVTPEGEQRMGESNPSGIIEKEYLVTVHGIMTDDLMDAFRNQQIDIGVPLKKVGIERVSRAEAEKVTGFMDMDACLATVRRRPRKDLDKIIRDPMTTVLRMTLEEGKYRQIRRMMTAAQLRTIDLYRIRIGNICIGSMPLGKWMYVDDRLPLC